MIDPRETLRKINLFTEREAELVKWFRSMPPEVAESGYQSVVTLVDDSALEESPTQDAIRHRVLCLSQFLGYAQALAIAERQLEIEEN